MQENGPWFDAVTLKERVCCVRQVNIAQGLPGLEATALWKKWRGQSPLHDESLFLARLNSDQITEDEFLQALTFPKGIPPGHLAPEPDWLTSLTTLYPETPTPQAQPFATSKEPQQTSFLCLAQPIL